MSTRTGPEDFRDLPILGELREELRGHFGSAAIPASRPVPRRWGRRTGVRLGVLLAAVVAAGGSALAAGLLSGERSRPLTATFPAGATNAQTGYGPPGSTYDISISPSMQTGVIGWCTSLVSYRGSRKFDLGTGGCNGAPPAVDAPVFGADDGGIGVAGLSYVFTAPQVAAVRVKDGPTILTRSDPRLPFGFRTAVFSLPTRLDHIGVALSALDAADRVIPGDAYAQPVVEATRSWRAPQTPPRGACSLHARPGSGPELQAGSILREAIGDPGLTGRAFLPCLNASFTLHGHLFAAAVLLDATHPGRLPAQLPDMPAAAGRIGVFARNQVMTNLLDDLANNHDIAARRAGNTWLVIAGGATARERIGALRAFTVRAALGQGSRRAQATPHGLCWIGFRPTHGLRALSQTATSKPPPILAIVKRRGWHTDGRLEEITVGHSHYLLPRNGESFLASPACATATFLMGSRTLEATVELAAGRGTLQETKGTTPIAGVGGGQALLRRADSNFEPTGLWQKFGAAWLHITGATTSQQEALLRRLVVTTRHG